MEKRDFIVFVMDVKKEILNKYLGKEIAELYFDSEDEKDIRNMSDDAIEKLHHRLRKGIHFFGRGAMFCSNICPFCIAYNYACSKCSYGHRHGGCRNVDGISDFSEIIQAIELNKIVGLQAIMNKEYSLELEKLTV